MPNLAPNTFGGLSGTECQLFEKLLANVTGLGVEIGCLDGFSTVHILEYSKLDLLVSIDPIIPDSMESSLIGNLERLHANVAPYGTRHCFVRDYSHAVRTWLDFGDVHPFVSMQGGLDFLFIDGDHNYAAVKQDFKDWAPLVKPGGLLAIHDSRMGRNEGANFHPGPSQVAAESIYGRPEQWEVVGEAYSLTVARKRTGDTIPPAWAEKARGASFAGLAPEPIKTDPAALERLSPAAQAYTANRVAQAIRQAYDLTGALPEQSDLEAAIVYALDHS
jgi:hypothetical protein